MVRDVEELGAQGSSHALATVRKVGTASYLGFPLDVSAGCFRWMFPLDQRQGFIIKSFFQSE